METEVLVDFVDDVLRNNCVISARHIDSMVALFAARGVKRLVWGYYGDTCGGYLAPIGYADKRNTWSQYAEVYQSGRSPITEAVQAAHQRGMEVYAYFKPYETGPGMVFPAGSPEAKRWGKLDHVGGRLSWLDPFVARNPHLRIQHRDQSECNPALRTIKTIKLFKKDDLPTRLNRHNVQIWTSDANYRYRPADLNFDCHESVVPAAADILDQNDTLIVPRGQPIRVLTLSGLSIQAPYVLITTTLKDGPADFQNIVTDIMRVYDEQDQEITGVFASGNTIYCRDQINFKDWGLAFDCGRGRSLLTLDVDHANGREGIIAFAQGRNPYLSGALCETEPAVQQHWLTRIRELLDAGVDGIEFRVENHSTHTDYPEEYGFNAVVLKECARTGNDMASVRGKAYTQFLRAAKQMIAARGKKMRINLNVDWFGQNQPAARRLAYPANISFQWQRWIDEGLLDQATLRSFYKRQQLLTDPFAREVTERCQHAGIPIVFNHHVSQDIPWFLEEFRRIQNDGRFAGCILYESNSFTRFSGESECTITLPVVDNILT